MKILQMHFVSPACLLCRADHRGFSDGGRATPGSVGVTQGGHRAPENHGEQPPGVGTGFPPPPSSRSEPQWRRTWPRGPSTAVHLVVRRGVTQSRVTQGPFPTFSGLLVHSRCSSSFVHSFIHSFILTEHLLYAWHPATGQDAVVRQ